MKKTNQHLCRMIASLILGFGVFSALAVDGPAIPNEPCSKDYAGNYNCHFGSSIKTPLPPTPGANPGNNVYYDCDSSSGDCGPTMIIYGIPTEQSKTTYNCTVKNGKPYWKQGDPNLDSSTLNFTCWKK